MNNTRRKQVQNIRLMLISINEKLGELRREEMVELYEKDESKQVRETIENILYPLDRAIENINDSINFLVDAIN